VLVVTLLGTQANRVTNLVEYEGTPASIDAPAGRGRSRFREDFDFDSFDFGGVTPQMVPLAPMSLSMTEIGGSQVTFDSLFGGGISSQPGAGLSAGDVRTGLDAGLESSWLRHGMFETDPLV